MNDSIDIFDRIKLIILQNDPFGLVDGGAPYDEYDEYIFQLIRVLKSSQNFNNFNLNITKIFSDIASDMGISLIKENADVCIQKIWQELKKD